MLRSSLVAHGNAKREWSEDLTLPGPLARTGVHSIDGFSNAGSRSMSRSGTVIAPLAAIVLVLASHGAVAKPKIASGSALCANWH